MKPQVKGLVTDDIQQALEFDWDISTDEESEDEMDDISKNIDRDIDQIVEEGEASEARVMEVITDKEEDVPELDTASSTVIEKIDPKSLAWRSRSLEAPDSAWQGERSLETGNMKSHIDYFSSFFDEDIISLIVNQSNLFSLQKNGTELKCTEKDIKQYIGILLYLGVVQLPQFKMAWSRQLNFTAVNNALSRNKFEKIKECIHFNDNTQQPNKTDSNYDKLYKCRPLLNILKEKFNNLPQEEHQSVDEQIIAYKGRSTFKQYNPAKPHKWGLKMFTRAGSSGMVYDFALYHTKFLKVKANTFLDFGHIK